MRAPGLQETGIAGDIVDANSPRSYSEAHWPTGARLVVHLDLQTGSGKQGLRWSNT